VNDHGDRLLSSALREHIDAPVASAGFSDALWQRIAAVDAENATAAGSGTRAALWLRGLVGGRRRRTAIVAFAVLAAAATMALFGLPGSDRVGVPGAGREGLAPRWAANATAGEVAWAMSAKHATLTAVGATMTIANRRPAGWYVQRGRVILTARGDQRVDLRLIDRAGRAPAEGTWDARVVQEYNADTRYCATARQWVTDQVPSDPKYKMSGWTRWGNEGVYPWGGRDPWSSPSSGETNTELRTYLRLAGTVRAALADGDPDRPVDEVLFDGRPAWKAKLDLVVDRGRRVTTTAKPGGVWIDQHIVIVDQETGLMVSDRHRWIGTGGYRLVSQQWKISLSDLDTSVVPTEDAFDGSIGPLNKRKRLSGPWWPVELAQASDDLKGLLLIPGNVPEGFELESVAQSLVAGFDLGAEPVVVAALVTYRRGFGTFTVIEARDSTYLWMTGDRFAPDRGRDAVIGARRVRLTEGSYAGRSAVTYLATRQPGPGLYVKPAIETALPYVSIEGDLTRAEFLLVAESLAPLQP
jgi:hypothetical protein